MRPKVPAHGVTAPGKADGADLNEEHGRGQPLRIQLSQLNGGVKNIRLRNARAKQVEVCAASDGA